MRFVAALLLLVGSASSELLTSCSRLQRPAGFTNVSTIVDSLALQKNEQVQEFVAETQNATLFEMFQCTYLYQGSPVVVATAICDSADLRRCVTIATYGGSDCSKASLCPNFFNDVPSFNADCSDISTDFDKCAVACTSNSSLVTGIDSCVTVADGAATEGPAPTSGTSAAGALYGRRVGPFLALWLSWRLLLA